MTPATAALTSIHVAQHHPTRYGDMTLADLRPDAWTVIATSRVDSSGHTRWDYRLDGHNTGAMFMAREAGALVTAQVKLGPDCYELRARLVRGKR